MSGLKVISCQSVGSNRPPPLDIKSKKSPALIGLKRLSFFSMRPRLLEDDDLDLQSAVAVAETLDRALKNSGSCLMKNALSVSAWNHSRTENACSLDMWDSQHFSLRLLKNLERHLNVIFAKEIFILVKENLPHYGQNLL